MATLSSAVQVARELAGTSSTGLGNSLVVDLANYVQFKMRKMLIDRGIDACPVQEATRSISDGVGTYLYPSDMFYIPKSVEINWFENPVTAQKFITLKKVEVANLPVGLQTGVFGGFLGETSVGWLRKNQSPNVPLIDYRGDYYEILPTPNASFWGGTSGSGETLNAALRIFYWIIPTNYINLTDNLNYPESIDYFSFGKLIKDLYFYILEKIDDLELESFFKIEVDKMIRIIQGEGQQPTKTSQLPLTGWEF